MKRIIISGLPRHIIQRGLQGRQTFLTHKDYTTYIKIMAECCRRYIEINPVKREYVDQPQDWPWSSARAHITECNDSLVQVKPLLERVKKN
ncbi:MAG: hypothetical protein ABIJ59_08615 [Pseudomonadota bacterium]